MSLDSIGAIVRAVNEGNGWSPVQSEEWSDKHRVPALLALLHSEVSEALEEFRVNDVDAFLVELADVQIRLLDIACGFTNNFEEIVRDKINKNAKREYRHGGKRV